MYFMCNLCVVRHANITDFLQIFANSAGNGAENAQTFPPRLVLAFPTLTNNGRIRMHSTSMHIIGIAVCYYLGTILAAYLVWSIHFHYYDINQW